MKDTIKSKNGGYRVFNCTELATGQKIYKLCDGEDVITFAYPLTEDEYTYNIINNECFEVYEVFTTVRGTQFIYCVDIETDVDYLYKVSKIKSL